MDFDRSMVLAALFPGWAELEFHSVQEDAGSVYYNLTNSVQTAEGEAHRYPGYIFVAVPRSEKPIIVQLLQMYPHPRRVLDRIQ